MSKIVVGMNRRPAIIPQRIDCGLRKTVPSAPTADFSQSSRCAAGVGFGSAGSSTNSSTLITRPAMPIPIQNVDQETPAPIIGPTTNWPAEPPAMPNICVAPMSVAAREAGKFVVAMYAAPISAKTPPAPCSRRPTLAASVLPDANSSAPTPTAAAPIGTTLRGPSRSIATPATRLNGE